MARKVVKLNTDPEYDPKKEYEWTPEDEFILDGNQFGFLINTLKNELFTPTGTSAKQKFDAYNILEEILKLAVKQGIATEKLPLAQIPRELTN